MALFLATSLMRSATNTQTNQTETPGLSALGPAWAPHRKSPLSVCSGCVNVKSVFSCVGVSQQTSGRTAADLSAGEVG